jgi:two-component system chemotaxis response regulator CheB
MQGRDIIVVGASAGGVPALCELVRGLPPGLPAALFVVCHFPSASRSILPEILSGRGPLLAVHAHDGEPVRQGQIYVAPPDYHLLLRPGRVELSHGPRENHHRPAIDPLFRSAARAYGARVVAIVLSGGSLSDGTAGLLAVRQAGGVGIVQDPLEAAVGVMPNSARTIAGADHVLPVGRIPPLLVSLVRQPMSEGGSPPMTDPIELMPEVVNEDMAAQERGHKNGQVSVYTCPECGGSLWQVGEGELVRFRCHVGHAYYADRLYSDQAEALEAALWTAVRTFKEKAVLARQLASSERSRGESGAAERFEEDARLAERYGHLIQEHVLLAMQQPTSAAGGNAPPGSEAGTQP